MIVRSEQCTSFLSGLDYMRLHASKHSTTCKAKIVPAIFTFALSCNYNYLHTIECPNKKTGVLRLKKIKTILEELRKGNAAAVTRQQIIVYYLKNV